MNPGTSSTRTIEDDHRLWISKFPEGADRCERFGLTTEAARKEIENVVATVRTWREHFRTCGVSAKDIEYIAPAFLPECFFFEKPLEG